ncbi:MAG TPA: DUF177 domain-containing protein [Rhizomicrobium sp.]|nr:DUF177 domain-containing protein [Rhizomicrobium sp.]
MKPASPPLERIYNLGRLARAGDEVSITAKPDELLRIAQWLEVRALDALTARVSLQKLSPERFDYEAEMRAEVTQDCVVTLEPVHSLIERRVRRELHFAETGLLAAEISVDAEVDDVREEISTLHYDLAAPLLEELALAIDPYPRAPGVTFSPPFDEEGAPESPFAVLKNLKKP